MPLKEKEIRKYHFANKLGYLDERYHAGMIGSNEEKPMLEKR